MAIIIKRNPGRTLLASLLTAAMIAIRLENAGPTKRDCEIYQGYKQSDAEISAFFVFDPLPIYLRKSAPRFSLRGNPELKDLLKIGENYCFNHMNPINPLGYRRIRGTPTINTLQPRQENSIDSSFVGDYEPVNPDSSR